MSKLRRFRVQSLENLNPGDTFPIPTEEARHIRVLRLDPGTKIELFDLVGRTASATLLTDAKCDSQQMPPSKKEFLARIDALCIASKKSLLLTLAVAWPKGKRAAFLVEKCSELGADRIIPVCYERSIVCKREPSESLNRLQRIAAEASKQCGRNDILELSQEVSFEHVLANELAGTYPILLDPYSPCSLAAFLIESIMAKGMEDSLRQSILLFIGPEGGLTSAELEAASKLKIPRVNLAKNVLRIETAAVAACSITRAILGQGKK